MQNSKMGHVTLTTPVSVIARMGLAMINLKSLDSSVQSVAKI